MNTLGQDRVSANAPARLRARVRVWVGYHVFAWLCTQAEKFVLSVAWQVGQSLG
jgi:hypothetical protein